METNTCNVNNHLDMDAFLPPRKRLLAGFKRQNSDVNPPLPLKDDILLNNPFIAQFNNSNLSYEDIVKASRAAAIEATKVAEAAKAKAEEKAAKAAKAVTAARNALDLVATLSEETAKEEKSSKKNKMKKRVTVEELYTNKNKGSTNSRTDEELARNLHRAINSSPRILNNSDTKGCKHKKVKRSGLPGRVDIGSEFTNGRENQTYMATNNGKGVVRNVETESPIKKIGVVMVDSNTSNSDRSDRLKLGNSEVLESFGAKRGRFKQKRLPLSICSFRDQTGTKDEFKSQGMPLTEDNNVGTSGVLFSSGNKLMPAERTSMRKCQSFNVPAGVEQNKVMQL
ncbi:hypothetical protein OROMI_007418 [Orobanche minor]